MKYRRFKCVEDYVVVAINREKSRRPVIQPQNSIMDASCLAAMMSTEDGYSCTVYAQDPGSEDSEIFYPLFRTIPVKG